MKRAIFLDRDGVINKVILKEGKPFSPREFDEFEFVENIKGVLEKFKEKGFLNIVITNQPDIIRRLMQREKLDKIHNLIKERLPIDDIFVCPHDDKDNCLCRKLKPGMLFEAAKEWDIDLNASFMIGDNWKDIEAGRAAGCTTVLIDNPYNKQIAADFRIDSISSMIEIISG